MTRVWPWLLVFSALSLITLPASAQSPPTLMVAQTDSIQCMVRVFHGSQAPGGMDKRLSLLKKLLSQPLFAAYKSIRLLEARPLTIPQASAEKMTLPGGKVLKLGFKEKLLEKGRIHLRLRLTISRPKSKRKMLNTLFKIVNRGTFPTRIGKHDSGDLWVGITCHAK